MVGGIVRYVQHGIPGGSFLTAVFANDLIQATFCADDTNRYALQDYALLLHWDLPPACYGSPERVAQWVQVGGLQGLAAAHEVANVGEPEVDPVQASRDFRDDVDWEPFSK